MMFLLQNQTDLNTNMASFGAKVDCDEFIKADKNRHVVCVGKNSNIVRVVGKTF